MAKKSSLSRGILLGALLSFSQVPFAADAVLQQANDLIQAGNSKAAYELLAPLQGDRAGEPDYDYLLGIAALELRRPAEAVFAFERVLAVNPDHAQARAEIARAYFELGELEASRTEFETVKLQGVPPEVEANINRYISAIDAGVRPTRQKVRGFVSFGIGWDSNVNAATDQRNVAIPAFGGIIVTLSDTGVEQSSVFTNTTGGISFSKTVGQGVDLIAGGVISNFEQTEGAFETFTGSAYLGLSQTWGKHNFMAAAQAEKFLLSKSDFRNAFGGVAQYQYAIDDLSRFSTFLQVTEIEYPRQEIRNATRVVGGVAYTRAFRHPAQPVVFLGAYGGVEDENADGVPHLGHDLYGFRAGGQFNINPKLVAYAAANAEFREYGGPDPLFLVTRDDDYYRVAAGLNYEPWSLWTITPEISYTNNDSNIVINDYGRTVVTLTVRRDF